MKHLFTQKIITILEKYFGKNANTVFEISPLLKYINYKTRSANRGSKARSSFANLYAIYVLVEDYLKKGFDKSGRYNEYEGAAYTPLLRRIQELPFGQKLQNHALNNRTNDEFHKLFPEDNRRPIFRKVELQKYWINENLLFVEISDCRYNIGEAIIDIIDAYVDIKLKSFEQFIQDCEAIKKISDYKNEQVIEFIKELISPEKDARIFEIVSYAILKYYYMEHIIFIGLTLDNIEMEHLTLYKTGRTNANDGGIDFVMKPLGRFFQVTETLDVKKYFLDIDKIERYPISFVIKTNFPIDEIYRRLEQGAREQYPIDTVVAKYMGAIEEIINIPKLLQIFDHIVNTGYIHNVLDEIIRWSKVEFNYMESTDQVGTVVDEDEDEDNN